MLASQSLHHLAMINPLLAKGPLPQLGNLQPYTQKPNPWTGRPLAMTYTLRFEGLSRILSPQHTVQQ
jgi:hypothetical protein